MAKDTIKVNMNVYDIPIVVELLKKLEQENKQLKEKLENYKQENKELKVNKNLNHVQKKEFEKLIHTNNRLIHCDEILTELEKWLEMKEEKETVGTYSMVQDKIQELKKKYKLGDKEND